MNSNPGPRPRLAFFGDDFSTAMDALYSLHRRGLKSVLFLSPPSPEVLSPYVDYPSFGVAGRSRSMTPAEMEQELRISLSQLKSSGAPIIHYVTSAHFDSAPHIGSIGKVLDIARSQLRCPTVPILAGAPDQGTFCAFGNLFASESPRLPPIRIDHHPTFSSHPVTPMTEADLRIHLRQQTQCQIDLFDMLALDRADPDSQLAHLLERHPDAILFDILESKHLPILGSLIDELGERAWPLFAIGSTSVEAALASAWGHTERSDLDSRLSAVDQILIINDGRSEQAQRQHYTAVRNGFVEIPVRSNLLARAETGDDLLHETIQTATTALGKGKSVILNAAGRRESQGSETNDTTFRTLGFSTLDIQNKRTRAAGPKLGQMVSKILEAHPLQRLVFVGSDAAAEVSRALKATAIEVKSSTPLGLPLCTLQSSALGHPVEILFDTEQSNNPKLWLALRGGTHSTEQH